MENTEDVLRWPEGWPRTRIQDRKSQGAWKKNTTDYQTRLEKELKRLGVTSYLFTRNRDRGNQDPGVAVYFSRKPINNYGWQEALGLIGVVPTLEQIDHAYRERAKRIHPDGPTPDVKMFHALTEHRDRARDWAQGRHRAEHEYVLACDVFDEVRLNINAIRLTIAALRQIERCGASVMLERAFRGFAKALTVGTGGTGGTDGAATA
jgi:hypothetical protein